MNKIEKMHLDAINSKESHDTYIYVGNKSVDEFSTYNAATESAKVTEQVSIEFAEWLELFGWNFNASKNCWWNIKDIDYFPTTKELFQEFLKTKQ